MTDSVSQPLLLELTDSFELFDFHDTGTIALHDVRAALQSIGLVVPQPQIDHLMHAKAQEGSAVLTLEEYIQFVATGQTVEEVKELEESHRRQAIRRALEQLDGEGRGAMTAAQLRRLFAEGDASNVAALMGLHEESVSLDDLATTLAL